MGTLAELFDAALGHHRSGNLGQAELLYRQILQADPSNADAHHLLGLVAHQTGHNETGASLVRQAISLQPAVADYHANLGTVLMSLSQFEEAAQSLQQALAINPNYAEAHYNLGNVHTKQGLLAEAGECFRRALNINPQFADAYNNLGHVLKDQGQLREAIDSYKQALRINPHQVEALNNLGVALGEMGQLEEGLACYRQAVQINPCHVDTLINMSTALAWLGNLEEADEKNDQALRVKPVHGKALWHRALLRLQRGDFAHGWRDYEQRLSLPGLATRHLDKPRWDGSSLEGKTILVHAEQGYGDTIQFLRYLPLVKQCGGPLLFECPAALMELCRGLPAIDQLCLEDSSLPSFDVQVSLLSLPGIFGTTLATIPADVPYLRADAEKVAYWRKEVEYADGFKVGIVWQGNPTVVGDRLRSIPLTYFEALARVPKLALVSLQKGQGAEQLRECAGRFSILDLGPRLETFSDTAAVMQNLDLIVSSCTSVGHLAGAMGLPVWTLLQLTPDWRWFLHREDSPWYPTMRLFRQKRFGDWREVFERAASELRRLTANR